MHKAVKPLLQRVVGGPLSMCTLILRSAPAHLGRKRKKLQTSYTGPANGCDEYQNDNNAFFKPTFLFFFSFFPCSCRESSNSEVPILVVGNKRDLQRQRFMPRRAVSVLVKKTWKCGYVECSAKFNWHVVLLFKELLGIAVARGMRQNHTSIRLQGALQRNRCAIM